MSKYLESKRKAQRDFSDRMSNRGYQRATIWIPQSLLKTLRDKAIKEGSSLQDVIVQSLEQMTQQIKS